MVGCGSPEVSPEPAIPDTEAEREAQLQELLDKIDVELPENWSEMTKQERGKFLLPHLMQVEIVEE